MEGCWKTSGLQEHHPQGAGWFQTFLFSVLPCRCEFALFEVFFFFLVYYFGYPEEPVSGIGNVWYLLMCLLFKEAR